MQGRLQRQLGRNLRDIRVSRGLSQEDFADRLGVHRTFIGGVERGERNLTLRSVERLAESLELDALRLLLPPDQHGEPVVLRAAADGREPADARSLPRRRPSPRPEGG